MSSSDGTKWYSLTVDQAAETEDGMKCLKCGVVKDDPTDVMFHRHGFMNECYRRRLANKIRRGAGRWL